MLTSHSPLFVHEALAYSYDFDSSILDAFARSLI